MQSRLLPTLLCVLLGACSTARRYGNGHGRAELALEEDHSFTLSFLDWSARGTWLDAGTEEGATVVHSVVRAADGLKPPALGTLLVIRVTEDRVWLSPEN